MVRQDYLLDEILKIAKLKPQGDPQHFCLTGLGILSDCENCKFSINIVGHTHCVAVRNMSLYNIIK